MKAQYSRLQKLHCRLIVKLICEMYLPFPVLVMTFRHVFSVSIVGTVLGLKLIVVRRERMVGKKMLSTDVRESYSKDHSDVKFKNTEIP